MPSDTAFFANELGKVYVGKSIIRGAVEPELTLENKFEPASSPKNSIDIGFGEGKTKIAVRLAVAYGINIQAEAPKIQERVKRSVEAITGLSVGEVTVNIERVFTKPEGKSLQVKSANREGEKP